MFDPFTIRIATLMIAAAIMGLAMRVWSNRRDDPGPTSNHIPRQGPMYLPGQYGGDDDDPPRAA